MPKNNGKSYENRLKANRKEDLDSIRGTRRIYDPEKGPANK